MMNTDFSRLYKFKKIDKYFFKLIKKHQLAFSNNTCLNDSYESIIRYTKMECLIENGLKPNITKDLTKPRYLSVENNYYFCMTTDNKSILMWGIYGNENKGVCLEFDFSDVKPAGLRFFRSAYRINNGNNNAPVIYPVEYKNDLGSFKINPDGSCDLPTGEADHVGTKKLKIWELEKEVRMRLTDQQGKDKIDNHIFWNFENKNLTGIYFGFKTTEKDRKKTVKYIKKYGYRHCRFYQADYIIMERDQPVVHYSDITDSLMS